MSSKIVTEFFSEINSTDISYCHWKSTDHLDASFLGDTDFDILVKRKDAFKFEKILLDKGFVRARTPDLRTYPCVEDYIYYDSNLNKFFHFHIHYQLPCGDRWVKSFHIPLENYILENRVYLKGFDIYNIDPISEYLFFIIRMNMKWRLPTKKKSVVKENDYLLNRINESNLSFDDIKSSYLYGFCDNKILDKYYHRELSSVTIFDNFRFKRKLFNYRRLGHVFYYLCQVVRYLYRLYVEFNRRVIHNYSFGRRQLISGGRVIAFIGMDGSGKSSMLEECTEFYKKQINVTNVFLGTGRSGAGFIRRQIFKVYGSRDKNKSSSNIADSHIIRKPNFLKLVWILLCLRDRNRELKKLFQSVANGNLVVVDRWPQSSVNGFADYPKLYDFCDESGLVGILARKEKKFYEKLSTVSVDKFLFFDIEPETSLDRKPNELTLSEAREYKQAMYELTSSHFSRVTPINAEQDFESVKVKSISAIWDSFNE
ncbi:hypothetical protein J5X89_18905 [Vibrio sp. G41H]|uniref:hypothetical protein n=1 Tax=unclassified Vibrio TaxID=2614977 RepID=UPI001AD72FE6|nr:MULTISPECIES: hypothetical protein [unclassified Vibrio]MBO7913690.1 hypothetical protein [Vibrio sp. G41H]MCF7492625.1 hypothetical protein [Vibrio sp. G-C-1]